MPAVQPGMDICGRNVEKAIREFAEATTTEIAISFGPTKIIARSALEVLLDEKS